MASFNVIGTSLIEPEEFFNKKFSGEIASLKGIDLATADGALDFVNERVELREIAEVEKKRDFSPIGIGKPLSVEIATVYVGEYRRFLGGRKDVMVVSGVKNAATFNATSRAINLQQEKIDQNAYLSQTAFNDGTKFVYYSPAMDAEEILISFEIMFDNFDERLFETISSLLGTASGVPVFLPAAPYLFAGSQLVNIGAKLGESIFSGRPALSGTIPVRFTSPLLPVTEPREFIIYNQEDRAEFSNLKVDVVDVGGTSELRLINKDTAEVYSGYAPYVIVLLDGKERQDLKSFTPTLASAALLKQFYGAQNVSSEITGAFKSAMQLYNDSVYKSKGEKLKKQMDKLQKESEAYKKLKSLYDSYGANIESEELKLPELTA